MSKSTIRASRLSTKLAQMSNPAAIQVLIEHEQAATREEGRQEERERLIGRASLCGCGAKIFASTDLEEYEAGTQGGVRKMHQNAETSEFCAGTKAGTDTETTDLCISCGEPITHLRIGTLLNGEGIHADPKCQNHIRLLSACNGVLADAKVSIEYADQVLISRAVVGELREALRALGND